MKELSENDRPREKLIIDGRRSLTAAELIAILIRTGTNNENAVELGQKVLYGYNNDLTALSQASVQDLCKFSGIGESKAMIIVTAFELGGRRNMAHGSQYDKIKSSLDIYKLMYPVFSDLNHEEFWIVILNKANFVKGRFMISKGGVAGTVADPKIIFKTALEHNAASIILLHNHPSGNLEASEEDIMITKKLIAAGRLLDLPVLDHLIMTNTEYTSMADSRII